MTTAMLRLGVPTIVSKLLGEVVWYTKLCYWGRFISSYLPPPTGALHTTQPLSLPTSQNICQIQRGRKLEALSHMKMKTVSNMATVYKHRFNTFVESVALSKTFPRFMQLCSINCLRYIYIDFNCKIKNAGLAVRGTYIPFKLHSSILCGVTVTKNTGTADQ
jgi:hypothetical protein